MARTYRHFKVHVSVLSHRKMKDVVRDPELFSLWVKLGLLAIESWAAKHDEEFYVSDRQLVGLTSKSRPSSAYRVMRRLVDRSSLSAQYRDTSGSLVDHYCDGIWQVQFTNLLKKQGFHQKNSERTDTPYKARKLSRIKEEKASSDMDSNVVAKAMKLFVN